MAEGTHCSSCLQKWWKIPAVIAVSLIVIVILAVPLILFLRTSDKCYTKSAVAADAGVCSTVGRDMLKRNGSAVDAAIAALLCVSLFNPHSMGIGGGVIFNIYNPSTGNVETIDARETAPRNVLINMFVNDTKNAKPGLFIAVPGELRGYEMAHKRHGRLPWKELFEPSIKLAWEGIQIGKALANAIQQNKEIILASETLCEVFCDSNNNTLKEKDNVRFPQLADTYRKIAEEGADAFYFGSLTQGVLDDINAAGGIITREDLKGYKPVLNEHALNFTVGNFTVYVANAPYGGPVLALILNILKGYNFSSSSVSTTENKILTYHHMIEAFRAAYEKKIKMGDPGYQNITEFIQNMMSDSLAEEIRSNIKDNTTQQAAVLNNKTVPADSGTSHLSVIAEDGSAVAVTSSINNYFGSKVMSHCTGIIFNDQIRDFSDPELSNRLKKSNLLQPGKRPLSSMSPTIILDKHSRQVKMVVGAAGGPNITTATAQVILNYLFFDYDLQKAVNEPRAHNQFNPSQTFVENSFDQKVTDGLKLKDHIIINVTALANVQAVVRQGNKVCAASDPRKGGYPDGY